MRATVGRLLPLPTRIETSVLAERAALEGALAMGLREARAQLFSRERRAVAYRIPSALSRITSAASALVTNFGPVGISSPLPGKTP